MSPGEYAKGGEGLTMRWGWLDTPFGPALAMATDRGLAGLAFAAETGARIVGAGGLYPVVGQTGGETEVSLETPHMPEHSHKLSDSETALLIPEIANVPGDFQSGGDYSIQMSSTIEDTSEVGGNQPHNNMPPYIALYFCRKD